MAMPLKVYKLSINSYQKMDHFSSLAEGCISEILSLTSPLDALRSSTTSKAVRSAAESDLVWDRFLPNNWSEILSTSVLPVEYASKKDLYSSLCNNPILIDRGKMSFCLDQRNGKKCFMLGARELAISWKSCWDFTSHKKSRFAEVAKLRSTSWIHIQGKIKTQMLSRNTTYAAYLVFWLETMDSLRSSTTVVRLLNDEHFETRETGKIAQKRRDGWIEIEMGKFYNGSGGDDGQVEAWLVEINSLYSKSGLVVEGIEFRPV